MQLASLLMSACSAGGLIMAEAERRSEIIYLLDRCRLGRMKCRPAGAMRRQTLSINSYSVSLWSGWEIMGLKKLKIILGWWTYSGTSLETKLSLLHINHPRQITLMLLIPKATGKMKMKHSLDNARNYFSASLCSNYLQIMNMTNRRNKCKKWSNNQ